jgi:hypothetical protein
MNALTLSDMPSQVEHRATPWAVTWFTWPLLFSMNILTIVLAVVFQWNFGPVLGAVTAFSIATLVILEVVYPMDQRWRMTWRSFLGRT